MPPTYDYKDLLELGRLTYNNISQDDETRETTCPGKETKKTPGNQIGEKNFLALATELISSLKANGGTTGQSEGSKSENGAKTTREKETHCCSNSQNASASRGILTKM